MPDLPPGLVAWSRLDGPSLLLAAVRQRAVRGFATESGAVRLELTELQRRQVARLLGTAWEVSGRAIPLRQLALALTEHGLTVRGLVEALDGAPLVENRQLRARSEAEAGAERSAAAAALPDVGEAVLTAWLADPGLPRAGSGNLLPLAGQVAEVWRQLPGPCGAPIRLAHLAARVRGDAHALDYRQDLGRAVARLIAGVNDLPRPLRADRDWRRAWAAAGVWCDEVSSQVLTLNLPLSGSAPAARWVGEASGEPLWLTLRSLAGSWTAPSGTLVRVCENPTVVEAAADGLGPACPPLICTDGIPSLAALDLVRGLAEAGCRIAVRADVDEAGFVVVDQIRRVAPQATLWRFDSATYLQYAPSDVVADRAGGTEPQLLRRVYRAAGTALHEEVLLARLLEDLAGA